MGSGEILKIRTGWGTKQKSLRIPVDWIREFIEEPEIVIGPPFVNGIPIPDDSLQRIAGNKDGWAKIEDLFDVMLVPNAPTIDTVPLPERTVVKFPIGVLRDLLGEPRFVIDPGVYGIPVPILAVERLASDKNTFDKLSSQFDLMLVPK